MQSVKHSMTRSETPHGASSGVRGSARHAVQEYRKIKRPFPPTARRPLTSSRRAAQAQAQAQAANVWDPQGEKRLGRLQWDSCNPLAHAATQRRGGCWARRWDAGWDNEHGRAARDGAPGAWRSPTYLGCCSGLSTGKPSAWAVASSVVSAVTNRGDGMPRRCMLRRTVSAQASCTAS